MRLKRIKYFFLFDEKTASEFVLLFTALFLILRTVMKQNKHVGLIQFLERKE